jgi:F0F1-type ATP synthase membrane subunit b/b'
MFFFPLFQSLKQAVSDFESNEMNDFRKQVQNILKTCNENSKNELQEISQGTFSLMEMYLNLK